MAGAEHVRYRPKLFGKAKEKGMGIAKGVREVGYFDCEGGGQIVRSARKASEEFGIGITNEVMISTEKTTMLMMTIGRDYFLALAMNLDGNLGRGRLELKKARRPILARESDPVHRADIAVGTGPGAGTRGRP